MNKNEIKIILKNIEEIIKNQKLIETLQGEYMDEEIEKMVLDRIETAKKRIKHIKSLKIYKNKEINAFCKDYCELKLEIRNLEFEINQLYKLLRYANQVG